MPYTRQLEVRFGAAVERPGYDTVASGTKPRTVGRLTIVLALSLVWVLVPCAPALAHASLVEAQPAAGAEMRGSPEQVRLSFTEPVEAEFDPVKVFGPAGERVDEENARVAPEDARVVVTDLEELPEGTYRVEWRVTSVDGHVVDDAYRFTVAAGGPANREGAGVARGEREERPSAGERRAAAQEGDAGSGPLASYTIASLGIVGLAVLAIVGANALRSRKTRS